MNFFGTDLQANKFTCCYRDGKPSAGGPRTGREVKTFPLGTEGLAAFYQTLTPQTYALAEAAVTAFAFARLFTGKAGKAVTANTYELKQASLARCNTDKIDSDKLCRIIKAQVLPGEQLVVPVTLPRGTGTAGFV